VIGGGMVPGPPIGEAAVERPRVASRAWIRGPDPAAPLRALWGVQVRKNP